MVSLLSKLLTPEGGFDGETLSYNEYTRIRLDQAGGTPFGAALSDLCDETKKEPRTLLLLAWIGARGRRLAGAGDRDERGRAAQEHGLRLRVRDLPVRDRAGRRDRRDGEKSRKRMRDPSAAAAIAAEALRAVAGPDASEATRADVETVAAGATEKI